MAPTILVVEDNPTMRQMLRVAVEAEGYVVLEAPDATTALALVEEHAPDLVLQDLNLPDMDGLELLRRLRARPGGTVLPIVALSGFLGRLEQARVLEAAFTTVLAKPIERNRLAEVIRRHLPRPQEPAARPAGERAVLLVDDDPLQLKLAGLQLAQLGFDVTAVTSVREAITAARARRPGVVLSDVFMPDADGFELCLAFGQDRWLSQIPVVLISSHYGSHDDQDMARKVGARALIHRTPDIGDAVQAIEAALAAAPRAAVGTPDAHLRLQHAMVVIRQLEHQCRGMPALMQRCALQAAELSLLGGVTDALAREADIELAVQDVLAATLDAAGISKGALILRDESGRLDLRQTIGFSEIERRRCATFFDHLPWLERVIVEARSVSIPSSDIEAATARAILGEAGVDTMHVVPLVSRGDAMGAMVIGATRTDVTTEDAVTFARAMGIQIVQSLELAKSVVRLATSERRYRTLFDGANDAIAVVTPDGIVREANGRWSAITGRSPRELIGCRLADLAPPRAEAVVERSGRKAPAEVAAADGSRVLLELSSTTVDVAGKPLVFIIGRDVTEQHQLEAQLRRAQKMEAVGQLAGGIAHDFNNLLTAINGFSEVLTASLEPGHPGRAVVHEITKAGERAAGLTRQLLAFSRRQILQPSVLDVNALVTDIQPMLARLIVEHVTLTLDLIAGPVAVEMDPTQVEQIIVNLAVNASAAMPLGGRLTIATGLATLDENNAWQVFPLTPGDYVTLAVSDSGVGMSEGTMRQIFEPFFTTKAVGEGTGLGLSTVYGIVRDNAGDIQVRSELEHGSCFTIYLPRVHTAVAAADEAVALPPDMPGGSETILVVEDQEAVCRLVVIALERVGYRVLAASSPAEAFRVAGEFVGPIALVLSDVIMPGADGPPLYQTLEAARPGLRVLYMSGYAAEAVGREGVMAPGAAFLQKPFTLAGLSRKVREVLDADHRRSRAAS